MLALHLFALVGGCTATTPQPVSLAPGEVEVFLADKLDGVTSGYCLDIAGGRENVDTSKGLQAHTCYSYTGTLGTDQIIDSTLFAKGTIRLPRYDVCATLTDLSAGSSVALSPCDGSKKQQFIFSGSGTIASKAAPTMCLTAAKATKSGKSSTHQIKTLTLEPCSSDAAPRQVWATRTSAGQ